MSKIVKDPIEKKEIVDSLSEDAKRIKVEDENGQKKWRDVDDLHDTDSIILKADGEPYIMNTKPGRKANPKIQAANEVVGEKIRQKNIQEDHDPLLRTIKADPDGSRVLDHILTGLAEEAFSLRYERSEAERQGEKTSAISVRRVNALKALGDTYLKRKEQIGSSSVDMDSNAFKTLFEFILETFRGAMEDSNLRTEMIETVFAKLTKRLEDNWEEEAKNKMKNGK